jgi:PTS system mannose-specific IIB component
MPLNLIRVDDRLIHGQVMAVWLRARRAQTIVIADDDTAADEFLAEVLTYAAPPGVEVEVFSVDGAAARLKEIQGSSEDAFLLMKSPVAAVRLKELGVPIALLNIGGMGAGPGRAPFYKNVSASEAELTAIRDLERSGTRVEIQIVADDKPVPVSSILSA